MSPSGVTLGRRRLRSKRDQQDCQPKHCKPQCEPSCSSSERCILDVMRNCGQCPISQCVSLSALGVSSKVSNNSSNEPAATSSHDNGNKLTVGLTTGLVLGAVVVVTIAGLVFYKRKRRTQQQRQIELEERVPTVHIKPMGPPPAPAVLPATTPLMNSGFWPKETRPPSPKSPVFMGNALQIPRLTTTPSTPPSTASTTIRQSLSLCPSTSSPALNRSTSVKLTKYDHRRANSNNNNDDDDLDSVQLRRAVSVKKKEGLSRSASLGSRSTEVVPIVYARPTMVRINTITRKENGITRKASVRTVLSTPTEPPPQLNQPRRTESWSSQHSVANSSHSSLGDGEITVFWDAPPPTRQQQQP